MTAGCVKRGIHWMPYKIYELTASCRLSAPSVCSRIRTAQYRPMHLVSFRLVLRRCGYTHPRHAMINIMTSARWLPWGGRETSRCALKFTRCRRCYSCIGCCCLWLMMVIDMQSFRDEWLMCWLSYVNVWLTFDRRLQCKLPAVHLLLCCLYVYRSIQSHICASLCTMQKRIKLLKFC